MRCNFEAMRKAVASLVVLATLVTLLSQGLQLVAGGPLLAAHLHYATTTTSRAKRAGWSLLAAALAAEIAWILVYVTAGEAKPAAWLIPLTTAVATVAFAWWRSAARARLAL